MQRKNFQIEAAVHRLPAERERKRNGDFVDPVKTECGGKGVVQFPAFSGFQKKGLFRSRTDAESILPAAGKKIQNVDLQSFSVGDSAGQNFHRKSFGAGDADVAECAGEFFHVAFPPADENGKAGDIVVVKLDEGWVPHVIEDDKSLTPICDCNGEQIIINVADGGDGDGYIDEEDTYQVWDGGGAAGY